MLPTYLVLKDLAAKPIIMVKLMLELRMFIGKSFPFLGLFNQHCEHFFSFSCSIE